MSDETAQQLKDNLRFATAAIKDEGTNIDNTKQAIEQAKKQRDEITLKLKEMKNTADLVSIEEWKAQKLSLFQMAEIIGSLQSNLSEMIQKRAGIEAFVSKATEAIEAIECVAPEAPLAKVLRFPSKLSNPE